MKRLAAILLISTLAHADTASFLGMCQSGKVDESNFCSGYIAGLVDAAPKTGEFAICVNGINAKLIDITIRHLALVMKVEPKKANARPLVDNVRAILIVDNPCERIPVIQ